MDEKGGLNEELAQAALNLHDNVEIKDRTHHFVTYHSCFLGEDAVQVLIATGIAEDINYAVQIGQQLLQEGIIRHVLAEQDFGNTKFFYQFLDDVPRGIVTEFWKVDSEEHVEQAAEIGVLPLDEHNAKFLDAAHPYSWKNPEPLEGEKYNIVVIGAGTAGLVTAASAAGVGATVAMIEQHLMGGDCLGVGCVPSKALIRCAKAAHEVRHAKRFGIHAGDDEDKEDENPISVDFGRVMEYVRSSRAEISPNDSATRFTDLGVDVYIGKGVFTSNNTIEVGDTVLNFSKAVIATGARAFIPPIEGINDVPYLTNANIWNLTELPESISIIGAGPIGCEIAQCFARFGSKVTVIDFLPNILGREDPAAAAIVKESLEKDGVTFILNSIVASARVVEEIEEERGLVELEINSRDDEEKEPIFVQSTHVLVSTGRRANVEGIGLEEAGVEVDRSGVIIDDHFQTSAKNIYACGDCCSLYKFTHAADFMARSVIRNALFFGNAKMSDLVIPWCTYTEPEVAHMGSYERDLDEGSYDVYENHFNDVDRAIVDMHREGFVKIIVKKGSDQILGATIVGPNAGDLISELTVAKVNDVGLGSIATVIHPYPTNADAIRRTGDFYRKTLLTKRVQGVFRSLMAFRR